MTPPTDLGVEPARIGNPHQVPARLDQVLPVRRDVPGYSESCFLTTWNPADGVGQELRHPQQEHVRRVGEHPLGGQAVTVRPRDCDGSAERGIESVESRDPA
jgi:hypothetical protein